MKLGDVRDRVRDVIQRRRRGSTQDGTDGDGAAAEAPSESGFQWGRPALTRRRLLGGVLGLGAAKAADNVLIGYGVLTGTNLVEQDLAPIATDHLGPSQFSTTVAGKTLSHERGVLTADGERYGVGSLTRDEARAADRKHGLVAGDERGPIEEIAVDWAAITADPGDPANVEVRPSKTGAFFDAIETGDARPYTTHALRGSHFEPAPPETVGRVTGADPAAPDEIVPGLMHAFEDLTNYDVPRYVAGSVEDNVIMGAADLRQHFESPITFDALESGANTGMFCYEFVFRSVDALHAVPAHRQTHPVVAGIVTDARHKHVYTVLASAVREGGELVVPLTFVDYTHSTLYDDLHADVLLGDGLEAYNTRHRATAIFWHDYVGGF